MSRLSTTVSHGRNEVRQSHHILHIFLRLSSKFDLRRYQSVALTVRLRWVVKPLISLNSDEPVLKHFSILIALPQEKAHG